MSCSNGTMQSWQVWLAAPLGPLPYVMACRSLLSVSHLGQEGVVVDLVDLLRVLGARVHHNGPAAQGWG